MQKFNGFSKIEIEILQDELRKNLPVLLSVVPYFATLAKAHYEELKKQGFDEQRAMYIAVQSAGKQLGFN